MEAKVLTAYSQENILNQIFNIFWTTNEEGGYLSVDIENGGNKRHGAD